MEAKARKVEDNVIERGGLNESRLYVLPASVYGTPWSSVEMGRITESLVNIVTKHFFPFSNPCGSYKLIN